MRAQQLWMGYNRYGRGTTVIEGVRQVWKGSKAAGFPLGPENLEKWEGIFQSGKSQGILNRLEKSGEDQTKYWKTQGNLR